MRQSLIEMEKQIQGFNMLLKLWRPLSFLGVKKAEYNKTRTQLANLQTELKELKETFENFNKSFCDVGWIAFDNMKLEVMKKAVFINNKNGILEAEDYLADYMLGEDLNFKILQLSGQKYFKSRINLIKLAEKDSNEKRYHSCIPIILMMIDGVVNDIAQTGFFTDRTDLSAWESVASYNGNLKKLSELFGTKRNKTNSDKINIPFRNGILHGRDLNYYNKIVAAKTWLALFAVADFIKYKQVEAGKIIAHNKKVELDSNLSYQWQSLKDSIEEYSSLQDKIKYHNECTEKWSPRRIDIDTLQESDMNQDSPEYFVMTFLKAWEKSNFGLMAESLSKMFDDGESKGKKAGKLRRTLLRHKLINHQIKTIEDQVPSGSLIEVEVQLEKDGILDEHWETHKFKLWYLDYENNPVPRNTNEGQWKIVDSFYRDLD